MSDVDFGAVPDYINAVVALGVGYAVWRLGTVQARIAQDDRVKEGRIILSYIYPELAILKMHLKAQADWLKTNIASFVHDQSWRQSVLARLKTYQANSVKASVSRLHVLPEDQANQFGTLLGNLTKLHGMADVFGNEEHARSPEEWAATGLYLAAELEQYAKETDAILDLIRSLNLRVDAAPRTPSSGEFG
ncbi:MAG TPA: hypothetical protein VM687_14945 [Stenotrophomonas sp.]|nr:hypothetical protein [Stenotrophomonas sp.]